MGMYSCSLLYVWKAKLLPALIVDKYFYHCLQKRIRGILSYLDIIWNPDKNLPLFQ